MAGQGDSCVDGIGFVLGSSDSSRLREPSGPFLPSHSGRAKLAGKIEAEGKKSRRSSRL